MLSSSQNHLEQRATSDNPELIPTLSVRDFPRHKIITIEILFTYH